MKYFISLISDLLFTFTVFAQGVLEIKQSRQTLKNLLADDQPMTVVYTAQNTGTQPVIITRVTPMTSLLKADWPKSPLLPGKSCDIKITFIPMQLLENFNMRILVYSNANPARKELILTGNLVDNPSKPELLYKYNMNGLKFKNNNINFKKVYTWQVATDTLEYYNTLKDAVSLGVIYKSNHLQATFETAQLSPGKKGKIIVKYEAPKAKARTFQENLVLINPLLPEVLAWILLGFYSERFPTRDVKTIVQELVAANPLQIPRPEVRYEYMIDAPLPIPCH